MISKSKFLIHKNSQVFYYINPVYRYNVAVSNVISVTLVNSSSKWYQYITLHFDMLRFINQFLVQTWRVSGLSQISRSRYYSTSNNSKTVQDRDMVTMAVQQKVIHGLLNHAIFNLLLLLVCVYRAISGQPRNSVFIHRVLPR